jgi:ATP-binding cassette, subfamily B, bacterial
MKLLFGYLARYKKWVLVSFLLATINTAFSLMDPVYLGKLYGYVVANAGNKTSLANGEFLAHLLRFSLMLVGVAMISRIAKAFQDYTVNTVIQRFGADVYRDGLRHSLQLPYQRFEDQRSGETLSILEKVKTDCEKFISSFVNVFYAVVVSVLFVTIFAFKYYAPITIVYFSGIIVMSFVLVALSRKYKLVQKNIVKETTGLAGATTETLRNIELIRSLGLTNQEVDRLNKTTDKILQLELRKVKSLRVLSFIQGTLVNLMRQIVVFVLGYAVFRGKIPMEQMLTLQFFSFFIFGPLQELGNIILSYREAEASLANFGNLMAMAVEPKPENPVIVEQVNTLTFDKVQFQHSSANTKALDGISFEVNKGETIAFVGPSGSGKTTLVKLLVGLYTPHQGRIVYNDVDYSRIDIEAFRNQIGFVTQDTQLFSGTVKENLQFVKPNATDEEMMDALRRASAISILERSEKGLLTVIGEGGMKVSGGEKQRLSIARALLRKPKLLVFDEATSALDSLTEEQISNTIRDISKQRDHITILIAHRLSTIMHADRIYVLERGNIIEDGNHESLVAEKGLYYAMWRQQIGERQKQIAQ